MITTKFVRQPRTCGRCALWGPDGHGDGRCEAELPPWAHQHRPHIQSGDEQASHCDLFAPGCEGSDNPAAHCFTTITEGPYAGDTICDHCQPQLIVQKPQ